MPAEGWLDTEFSSYGESETSLLLGPKFLSSSLYKLCPVEDFTLAATLMRPGSLFLKDLSKLRMFSNEGYGRVSRACVVCKEDAAVEFQQWMVENNPAKEVKEIDGADHIYGNAFKAPQQLCHCLLDVALIPEFHVSKSSLTKKKCKQILCCESIYCSFYDTCCEATRGNP